MLLLLGALAHAASVPGPVAGTLDVPLPAGARVGDLPAEVAQAIWQVELLRLPPTALSAFARDPSSAVRARAADALGRLRVEAATPLLAELAGDAEASVRTQAAFALGLTPGTASVLGRRWGLETDIGVRRALATALGKQGGPEAVEMLVPALSGPVSVAAADGLGRLATRKVAGATSDRVVAALLDTLTTPLFDLVVVPIGATRQRAAWALGRMGLTTTSPDNAMRLRSLALNDGDHFVRAWALRAWLGVSGEAARLEVLVLAAKDPDVGVRIAAARGAARHAGPGLGPVLDRLVHDPEVQVRIEALAAVAEAPGVDAAALALPGLTATEPVERAAALRALAKKKALPSPLPTWLTAEHPMVVRIAAVESLEDHNRLLFLALRSEEPALRSAAAGVLLGAETPRTTEVLEILGGADLVLAEAAAQVLAEHPDPAAEGPLLAYVQRKGLSEAQAVSGVKALVALYNTGRLPRPGSTAASVLKPWLRHPDVAADAARLASLLQVPPPKMDRPTMTLPAITEVMRIRSARITTTRGEILVDLRPDRAPYTVWNFARLAEQGYYDGLTFHRVVPDFVIQAGDPRGDGWGGPGYEIPDEINDLPYDTGAMGMALSGPDTGGSQWFITLSPQPHLDGTYTVFGHITTGLRSAQGIQVGDRIEKVVIERG